MPVAEIVSAPHDEALLSSMRRGRRGNLRPEIAAHCACAISRRRSAKVRRKDTNSRRQTRTIRQNHSCLSCVSAGPGRCPKTNKHRAWLQPMDPFQARVQPSENSAGRPERRFGRPCPMALECLADSRANCFATADLTLMRSLRKKAF